MNAIKAVEPKKNLQPVLDTLHEAFDKLNTHFYEGKLPEVIIAIQAKGKSQAYGWFTPWKSWEDGAEGKCEITITAEHLNRPMMEVLRTLHHEMIHLYCFINNIKETSRQGKYHNKKFKEVSEAHGFYYDEEGYDKKIGWSFSKLTPETVAVIESWNLDASVFGLARKEFGTKGKDKAKKKSNIIKWVCPSCGDIIRTSKADVQAMCVKLISGEGDEEKRCMKMFEPEIAEGIDGSTDVSTNTETLTEKEKAVMNWLGRYQESVGIDSGEESEVTESDIVEALQMEVETVSGVLEDLMTKLLVVSIKVGIYVMYGLTEKGMELFRKGV